MLTAAQIRVRATTRWRRIVDGETVQSLSVQAEAPRVATGTRSPFRTLVLHLFACFFALEESASTTPATLMLQVAVALSVPPLMLTLALYPSYNGTVPWMALRTFWQQSWDHYLFVTYSCAVTGIAALLKWEGFFPTLLDVRVLSVLPISNSRLFAAKVLAAVGFVGTFLVGADLSATIMLPGIAGSHHEFQHIAAHLAGVTLGGCFTVTFCMGLMSGAALIGGRGGRLLASLLQGLLLAGLLPMLFLAPALGELGATLLHSGSRLVYWLPPMWFTGVYEVLKQSTADSRQFTKLAEVAVLATVASFGAVLILYPLAYRRRARELMEGGNGRTMRGKALAAQRAAVFSALVPRPKQAAAFYFLGQTMFRLQRFRVLTILAASAGAAVALTLIAGLRAASVAPYLRVVHVQPVAMATMLVLSVTVAVYVALSSAVEPGAAWLFDSTVGRFNMELASGMRRWVFLLLAICGVGGVVLLRVSFAAYAPSQSWREIVLVIAACLLLTELTLRPFGNIPFTTDRLRRQGMAMPVLLYVCVVFPTVLYVTQLVSAASVRHWITAPLWLGVPIAAQWTARHYLPQPALQALDGSEDDPFQRLRL